MWHAGSLSLSEWWDVVCRFPYGVGVVVWHAGSLSLSEWLGLHASSLTVSEYLFIGCQDLHMLHAYFNTSQGIFTNVSLDKHRFYLYIRWAVSTMVVILEIQ